MNTINGEPVEKVTSFESLRAGDIVWNVECRWCSRRHRMMLISLLPVGLSSLPGGDVAIERGWTVAPRPPCTSGLATVGEISVRDGRVYRVVLDLGMPDKAATDALPQNEVAKNIRALLAAQRMERAK